MEYSIIEQPPLTDFFYLHPVSGILYLSRVLDADETVDYRVCTVTNLFHHPHKQSQLYILFCLVMQHSVNFWWGRVVCSLEQMVLHVYFRNYSTYEICFYFTFTVQCNGK